MSWLRAKHRKERWTEEITYCKAEMGFTHYAFLHHKEEWAQRAQEAEKAGRRGHQAMASKQADAWDSLATEAWKQFGPTYERFKAEEMGAV